MDDLDKVLLSPKSLKENSFHPNDATLDSVIQILKTPAQQRSLKQLSVLTAITKNIRFFIQKSNEIGVPIHVDSCKVMSYEFFDCDQFVFEMGSIGNKFYIIIEGTVAVLVPVTSGDEVKMVPIAQLGSGMAFGELALLKDQPRSASIKCVQKCHMAVLVKEDYMKIIGRAEEKILDKQIDFLKGITFFSKWSKRKLEKLNYYFSTKKYSRKQVVYHHGSESNFVYIVKSGEFELTKPLLIEKDKTFTVKIALLGRGEMFGEEEAVLRVPNSNTCTCYSSVGELLMVSSDNFLLKFYSKPDIQDDISRKIKYEIRENRVNEFKKFCVAGQRSRNTVKLSRQAKDNSFKQPKKVIDGSGKSASVRFSPLNTKQLQSIKSRALGVSFREKLYIHINTPYETVQTEENDRSLDQKDSIFRSFHEMITHQPGGYYRGRLKRPRYRQKSMAIDFD